MNYYNVSTKEALKAGMMNLKYIPLALMFSGGMVVFFLFFKGFLEGNPFADTGFPTNSLLLFFGLPFASFIASIAWRSFHSAAWKIWVLENVQDIHRVYQLAVSEGLIFERSSWMNKLEYRNYDQKTRLEELEKRLDEPRQMELAGSMGMAGEQEIPYSFKSALTQSLIIVGMFAGFYAFATGSPAFPPQIFIVPLIFIGILLVRWLPRLNKPAPIRFNNKELTVTDHPTVAWTNITDIRIEMRQHGKSKASFLVVETIGSGNIDLNVGELQGSAAEIEDTLYQYWALAKKHATNHP